MNDGAACSPATRAAAELAVLDAITDVPRADWDRLLDGRATPFLEWSWLEALEHAGCVAEGSGWRPRHLALFRGLGGERRLVAAAPAYVREDSDGDFSRDWGWADGAARAGLAYYPKLVLTVPFTPATGRRFLVAPGEDRRACMSALVDGARELAVAEGCSSVQVLFPDGDEAAELEQLGMARRLSYQFHWRNDGYRSPEEFFARFGSKRRNQLRRERAAPAKQGIAIRTVRGDELSADARSWARFVHRLHRATVAKMMWGRGWLNQAFYERVFERMAGRLEVVEARHGEGAGARPIAMAFNVASRTHLYGRYWGCDEEHPFLHFNVCLYHSIDECIGRGVEVFEGGAGGDHKLVRGFEPVETFSAHLFFDPRMDAAVRRNLREENRVVVASLARWRADAPVLKREAS